IFSHELAAVERRFVVPFDAVTQVEDIGGLIRLLPPFGEVRLHGERPRGNLGTYFVPHQRAVDEAQCGIGLETDRPVVAEVGRTIPPHGQDAATFGRPCFRRPESLGTRERPGRPRDSCREASFEQIPTTHPLPDMGISLRCFHTSLSLLRWSPPGLSNCLSHATASPIRL